MVTPRHPQRFPRHGHRLLSPGDRGTVTTTIRLSRPDELLAAVPYLLGFHPRDSLVLIMTRAGRLHLVCRYDLPVTQAAAAQIAAAVAQLSERDCVDPAAIVAFEGSPGRADPARQAVRTWWEGQSEAPVEIVVRDRRWWLAGPDGQLDGPGCCGPDGDCLPALAEWVAAGISPLTSREALHQALEPTAVAASLDGELASRRVTAAPCWSSQLAAWGAVLDLGRNRLPIQRHDVVLAAIALDQVRWRDALISWLAPACGPARTEALDLLMLRSWGPAPWAERTTDWASSLPGSGRRADPGRNEADRWARAILARHCLERLTLLTRSLPTGAQVPALTVLAAFAWSLGDGARAAVALDRALWIDPTDTLAGLLQRLVRLGIRLGRN